MRLEYEIPLSQSGVLKLGQKTLIMGILNVTPDSFSDGGKFLDLDSAVEHGIKLAREGADIIDVGGESTRPGSDPLPADEELRRVIPVIERVKARTSIPVSIDTYKSEVAEQAIRKGAEIINDISGFKFDRNLPEVVRASGAAIVLMHLRGIPKNMHQLPPSEDILQEIKSGLMNEVKYAESHHIRREKIIVDPGIGFGKDANANLKVLYHLEDLKELGFPILIGTSRKSFIGKVLNLAPSRRLLGTAATVCVAIIKGAHIVRVHDVKPIKEVTQMVDAILSSERQTFPSLA